MRALLMGLVEQLGVFSDPRRFYCQQVDGGFCVGYSGTFAEQGALLGLQTTGAICYLLSIQIPRELRGGGQGRGLYAAVEEFASLMGVTVCA